MWILIAVLFVVVVVPILLKGAVYILFIPFAPFVAAYRSFKNLKSENRKERIIGRLFPWVFGLLLLALGFVFWMEFTH